MSAPSATATAVTSRTTHARWASELEALIGRSVAAAAGLLLAIEVVLLFTGVVARYAFKQPITWADELASVLFVWLSMFGAAIAVHRGEHMRLTVFAQRASPAWQRRLDAWSVAASTLFCALLVLPTIEYVRDEAAVMLPGLGISAGWRTSAMLVGAVLMLALSLLGAWRRCEARPFFTGLGLGACLAVVLWLGQSTIQSWGIYSLPLFFVGLVGLLVAGGVPIAFSFGLASIAYLATATHVPLTVVVSRMEEGMSHLVLLSVPLFVVLGMLIAITGMARSMIGFLVALLGHVRGGLSYVLLGGMYLVSGISGSKAADMAAIAPVLLPEMKRRGAKPGELVSLLASSAAMSETIPPSLVLITIGSVAGVSIAALFSGGLLPALVLAVALAIVAGVRSRKESTTNLTRAPWSDVGRLLLASAPALALPFIIRAAVVEGVATATEVSTLGIAYALLCGALLYRDTEWRRVAPMLVDAATLSGAILIIIGAASAMAWALTQSGFSRQLAAVMSSLPGGATTFVLVSAVAFIVLGSVLEGIPALVLFAPLLFPVSRALGIHDVHYAMVIILAMGVGLFAPPIGVGYYTACAISKVDPAEGMRLIWPYVGALVAGLLLVALFPQISLALL